MTNSTVISDAGLIKKPCLRVYMCKTIMDSPSILLEMSSYMYI